MEALDFYTSNRGFSCKLNRFDGVMVMGDNKVSNGNRAD